MTDYSKMSEEQLKQTFKELSQVLNPIITLEKFMQMDPESVQKQVIQKLKAVSDCSEIDHFYNFLREWLYREIKEIAIVIFLYMDKAKKFEVMGEQRVSISFCRNLLRIPNNREVTQFDADRFRKMVDEVDEKFENKPHDFYLNYVREYTLDFFGKPIKIDIWSVLNNYFEKIGFDYFIEATFKITPSIVFAKAKKMDVGDGLNVYVTGEELIRTPDLVLSYAALGHSNKTIVRKESCEVIFFNKWQKYFDKTKLEHKRALNHLNTSVAEGIKNKALDLYVVKSKLDIENIKKVFIDDMIDGIIWHELGHKVGYKVLNKELRAIAVNFFGTDKVPNVIWEAVADWATRDGKLQGAMSRFCEIAKKDIRKATRCTYVYLSDNWFVDDKEEFLDLQTDILTALVLNYIDLKGNVDFSRMEKEIEGIFDFIIKNFESIAQGIKDIVRSSNYSIGAHILNYEQLEDEIMKMFEGKNVTKEELYKNKKFWHNLLVYVDKFSPEGKQKLDEYLTDTGKKLKHSILRNITKGNTAKYNDSLRDYIYAKYKEIGLLKEPVKINWQKAIDRSMTEIKLPDEISQKVKQKFEKIMNGEEYDISINYEGKKDPFIATIQNMMLKSDYGSIKAPIVLGDDIKEGDDEKIIKDKVKDELDTIRDQLDSEMYLEVNELVVTSRYKEIVKEILPDVKLYDGTPIKEKIETLKAGKTSSGSPIEAYIPLKIGYMDWNTSQAVWRINQDLRPEEFIMQWTIDHHFLEELVQAYS